MTRHILLLILFALAGCGDLFSGTHVGTSENALATGGRGLAVLRPIDHLRFPGSSDSILRWRAWNDLAKLEDSAFLEGRGILSVWGEDSAEGSWNLLPVDSGALRIGPTAIRTLALTDSTGVDSLWAMLPGTGIGVRATRDSTGAFAIRWRVPPRRWPLVVRSFRDGLGIDRRLDSLDLAPSATHLDLSTLVPTRP